MISDEIFAPLFLTDWGRRTGWGLLVVSGLIFIFMLCRIPFSWYDDATFAKKNLLVAKKTILLDSSVKNIAAIPKYHLFGKEGELHQGFIPMTSLQLKLVGVILAIPEHFSKAIISEKGHIGKAYQIGDSLPEGVIIHSITAEGVFLQNGDRLEKLLLSRPQLQFQSKPRALPIEH